MIGPMQRQTIPLEAFLAVLPPDEAAQARASAARIDALERQIGPPGWLEQHLMGLGLGALVLFTLGVLLLAGRAVGLVGAIGSGAVVPMLAAFPALVLAYVWSVRGRTRLDREKMDLNERHFMPHGGIYFGARGGTRTVMRVERSEKPEPTLRDRAHALHAEATRRRWWW